MDKFVKAKRLFEQGRVKFKGRMGSSLYFEVLSNETHQVIFRPLMKKWLCDCKYASLYDKDCSHVLACKYWLEKHKEVATRG